ncbi:response regulator [Actinoplanes sp. Pm04-4]|uniref:Response regulator n=1 Tax=Paractinoplanes pyxinae TaxID=2997416 RepID=A0ABT4BJ91_9ACTN|nr:response regulator [Actinoplanes pyxinae]MCY1145678.1 response regulator [Actinoplanes pyxinae]
MQNKPRRSNPERILDGEGPAWPDLLERKMAVLLIAEDDDDVRTILGVLFTGHGFTVVTARDGSEALQLAQQRRPDVVLTDIDMPGLDGEGLCKALRADPRLHTVPVAILSGSQMDRSLRAHDLAFCELMIKPTSNRILIANIKRLVERGSHEHGVGSAECRFAA